MFNGIFLFSLFIIFHIPIENLISKYVIPIYNNVFSSPLLGIVILISLTLFTFKTKNRKFESLDVFFILLFSNYRILNQNWQFIGLFRTSNSFPAYFDLIAFHYSIWFFFYLRNRSGSNSNAAIPDSSSSFIGEDLSVEEKAYALNTTILEIDAAGLKRNRYAMKIAEILSGLQPQRAFAFGISGSWGSGKSSLISLILHHLKENKLNSKSKYIVFNPWLNLSSTDLTREFFNQLEEEFLYDKSLRNYISKYAKVLNGISDSVKYLTFLRHITASQSIQTTKDQISNILVKKNIKLYIIIDEIDRLPSHEVVMVLKIIRTIADFKNIVYILSYSREYITYAVKEHLTKHSPDKYIDKIITHEFHIPAITNSTIATRLESAIRNKSTALSLNSYRQITGLKKALSIPILNTTICSERDIIRFSNSFVFNLSLVKDEVSIYQFFLIELLRYQNPSAIEILIINKNQVLSYQKTNELNLKFESAKENQIVAYLLENAFNETFSIRKSLYFYRYFTLEIEETQFSYNDFIKTLYYTDVDESDILKLNEINAFLLYDYFLQTEQEIHHQAKSFSLPQFSCLIFVYITHYNRDLEQIIPENELLSKKYARLINQIIVKAELDNDCLTSIYVKVGSVERSAFLELSSIMLSHIFGDNPIQTRSQEHLLLFIINEYSSQNLVFDKNLLVTMRNLIALYKSNLFQHWHPNFELQLNEIYLSHLNYYIDQVEIIRHYATNYTEASVYSASSSAKKFMQDHFQSPRLPVFKNQKAIPLMDLWEGLERQELNQEKHFSQKFYELSNTSGYDLEISFQSNKEWKVGIIFCRKSDFSVINKNILDNPPFTNIEFAYSPQDQIEKKENNYSIEFKYKTPSSVSSIQISNATLGTILPIKLRIESNFLSIRNEHSSIYSINLAEISLVDTLLIYNISPNQNTSLDLRVFQLKEIAKRIPLPETYKN